MKALSNSAGENEARHQRLRLGQYLQEELGITGGEGDSEKLWILEYTSTD